MQYDTLSDFLLAFAIDKDAFTDFLQRDYEECQYPSDNDEHLVLSTIHSAKGLEWESVFIIGAVDGRFPSAYSFNSSEVKVFLYIVFKLVGFSTLLI